MALTKTHIVEEVVKIGFTKKKSAQLVDTFLGIIKSTLENGEDILISGFGKFYIKNKRERRGRNPQTGQDLPLPERRVVTFKCSGVLRNKINGK
jgi:integration host factor subunit alpha